MAKRVKHRKNPVGVILQVLGIIVLAAIAGLCSMLVVPRVMKLEPYNVVSGSMEPNIPVGGLVYVDQTPPEEIQEGDVIAFYSSVDAGAIITHRVVENYVTAGEFVTKGDANPEEDAVRAVYDCYRGKVVKVIPKIGYILAFIASQNGKFATAGVVVAAFILTMIGSSIANAPAKRKEK